MGSNLFILSGLPDMSEFENGIQVYFLSFMYLNPFTQRASQKAPI